MTGPRGPRLEARRASDFEAELRERAQAWIPSWGLADEQGDFGQALLRVAARFDSEVAERLDLAGEKMRLGFLDWLGVRGEAARPARMPVVLQLTTETSEPVFAPEPVRLQADADGTPVVFETENDVCLVRARLQTAIGVDERADAFFRPPPGLFDLQPLEPSPSQWRTRSFAAAGSSRLSLDPEVGLAEGMVLEAGGREYRLAGADSGLATLERPLEAPLPAETAVHKVTDFAPFESAAYNEQEHALYLGHSELLEIESAATLEILGAAALGSDVEWQYWGKQAEPPDDATKWWTLEHDEVLEAEAPGSIVLKKPKGAIEPKALVPGKESRWLRAWRKTVPFDQLPFHSDALRIRINAAEGCDPIPCSKAIEKASLVAEGMANTTPLVLEKDFFPLGREPRQFDAFYLGSAEAFSKPGAQVQLCFELAGPTFSSLAHLKSGPYTTFMAGVAKDRHLYLLQQDSNDALIRYAGRAPLRPPSPKKFGVVVGEPPVSLDARPELRPAVWSVAGNVYVAVSDGSGFVWVWFEFVALPAQSGWDPLGAVDSGKPVDALVYVSDGGAGSLVALCGEKIFVRKLNQASASWVAVTATDGGGNPIAWKKLAPIWKEGAARLEPGDFATGILGIDANQTLWRVTFSGSPLVASATQLLTGVALDQAPAGVERSTGERIAVAVGANQQLLGRSSLTGTASVPLDATTGHRVDVGLVEGQLTFALCVSSDPGRSALAIWTPFQAPLPDSLFVSAIPETVGAAAGDATLLPKHVAVPAINHVLLAAFDPTKRTQFKEELRAGIVSPNALLPAFEIAIPFDDGSAVSSYDVRAVGTAASATPVDGEMLYEFDLESVAGTVYAAPASLGDIDLTDPTNSTFVPQGAAPVPQQNDTLLIETNQSTRLYLVQNDPPNDNFVQVLPPLDVTLPSNPIQYDVAQQLAVRHLPVMRLDATSGDWYAAVLDRTRLSFPNADPARQRARAIETDANGKARLVLLEQHWATVPPHPFANPREVAFIVDAALGDWLPQLADTSSNPDLSWEYWNGTSWSNLGVTSDLTLDLKQSGALTFDVPTDLQPTDWAGKTEHWIRARLVGGDYGRQEMTVVTSPPNSRGETTQTFRPSTAGIRAPLVLQLHISYRLCHGVLPTFVLSQDNGSFRDQSDANETPGEEIEAFVSLYQRLTRLERRMAEHPDATECDDPACHCQMGEASAAAPQPPGRDPRRALFLGFAGKLAGAPVNVLALVAERRSSGRAPSKVEALASGRFAPVVASDGTRALGESGVLALAFSVSPTEAELFGESLSWLRLTPPDTDANAWSPTLRGVYVNAVWASAAESLTRELLGSSQGGPGLTLQLARPPLLAGSLELRVREPLGEEQRSELQAADRDRVVNGIPDLPGDWVRWNPVPDPDDCGPDERVYALDEATGTIRFGDGRHGMVPPPGNDSIVAFRYRRTEAGPSGSERVPGNQVAARSAVNVISPLDGVEAAFAADHAAGGTPSESAPRVLRFGTARLRHRQRALTARDLEDLALQSSPDVVQARCFRRDTQVRLVVVMRGADPIPSAPQRRELRRLLLSAAPVALSAAGALRIEGPTLRRLRIELALRVPTLDAAGELARGARQRITAFFDTATGGIGAGGYPLGESPSESDVAFALLDAPGLEAISNVMRIELLPGGVEQPWPDAIAASELAVLAADPIRIDFASGEEAA